jgi:hypothetical protein
MDFQVSASAFILPIFCAAPRPTRKKKKENEAEK